jgi:hypothetical protein
MKFTKHPLFLNVGFVEYDWQLACLRWFVFKLFKKIIIQTTSSMPAANHVLKNLETKSGGVLKMA